ncbi:MAG: zincin-like metallopeptidase domain-containing protein [Halodesulfovibrio sp.]|uniref:zincin-like metallopeptidase domain-containing protein n=1 Tax=Halodesulfovibrio sp. TaxID=1912772 RepID=UPI00359CC187
MAAPRKPFHQEFAEQIIEDLKQGTAPWQKPWKEGEFHPPFNPISGTVYSGVNFVSLAREKKDDPRFVTFNQASKEGWRIKKGSKARPVVFWQFTKEVDALDDNGKPILNDEGKTKKVEMRLERPIMRFASVFHATQIDGIPEWSGQDVSWNPHERSEAILEGSGASITHDQRDRAFFSPTFDEIKLPPKDKFDSQSKYYATALHELGHWTGHEKRWDGTERPFGPKGTEEYAREELNAEIGSWMTAMELGLEYDRGQHLSYVDSWVKVLEKDPYEIMRACQTAERIKGHMLGFEKGIRMEKQEELAISPEKEKANPLKSAREFLVNKSRNLFQPTNSSEEETKLMDEEIQSNYNHKLSPELLKTVREAKIALNQQLGTIENNKDLSEEDKLIDSNEAIDGHYDWAKGLVDSEESEEWCKKMGVEVDSKEYYEALDKELGITRNQEKASQKPHPKTYLDVPYSQKHLAKKHGAKWDKEAKKWFAPEDANMKELNKWLPKEQVRDADLSVPTRPAEKKLTETKTYLAVPFSEKGEAKKLGAKWDGRKKSWYAPEGTEMTGLSQWLPKGKHQEAKPQMAPEQEFGQALRNAGLILEGLPLMDGKLHRVPVEGGKLVSKDGAYTGYLDGRPAGFIENHKTGFKTNWKANGHKLSPEAMAEIKANAAARQEARELERKEMHDRAAKRAYAKWKNAKGWAPDDQPYLKKKGVKSHGVKVDAQDNLLVPGRDTNGRIQTLQTITPDKKLLESGGEKAGAFHIICHYGDILPKQPLLIAEGYATGASIHEATRKPVAVAFDAGNLEPVARRLKQAYPDSRIVVLADDDHKQSNNPGVTKARAAAQAVAGSVVIPQFTEAEKAKGLTDFNDLHQERGLDALKVELNVSIRKALTQKQDKELAI